ncbi:MAG: TonB family protein [Rudaea sp.]
MNLPQGFIGIVDVFGTVLLHFVWQGAIVGLVYALARPLSSSMSARYRLGLSALIVLALCPLATFAYLWSTTVDGGATGSALPTIGASVMAVADRAAAHWQLSAALPWMVGGWSIGVLILATRSLWQWRRLVRMVRDATEPAPEWTDRLTRLRARFGLRRPVRLLCSARAVTPMLIGWIRPIVLLPASMMSGFTPAQIELIIAHELGHVCRWDYVANLFQVVLETVLFYHPVVHWISHDVRNARESCCDDLVLDLAGGNPLVYARTLADLEELRHNEAILVPALGASGGILLERIRHIVGVSAQERTPRTHSWPILLIAAAVALLAWRQHPAPTLSETEAMKAAIANAPAQAMALVSGNAQLAAVPTMPSAMPAIAAPNVDRPSAAVEPVPAEPMAESIKAEPIKIEQPRVALGRVARLDAVRNVIAPATMSVAAIQLAEPEVAPATESADAAIDARLLSPLHVVPPVYPEQAMAAHVEGNVELEFSVSASGTVSDIRTVKARPAGIFDAAAKAALREWRFAPTASAGRHTQNFKFALRGGTEDKCQQTTGSMICRRPGE